MAKNNIVLSTLYLLYVSVVTSSSFHLLAQCSSIIGSSDRIQTKANGIRLVIIWVAYLNPGCITRFKWGLCILAKIAVPLEQYQCCTSAVAAKREGRTSLLLSFTSVQSLNTSEASWFEQLLLHFVLLVILTDLWVCAGAVIRTSSACLERLCRSSVHVNAVAAQQVGVSPCIYSD